MATRRVLVVATHAAGFSRGTFNPTLASLRARLANPTPQVPAGAGSATAGSATVSLGEPVELVVAAPDFLGHGSKSDFSLKAQDAMRWPDFGHDDLVRELQGLHGQMHGSGATTPADAEAWAQELRQHFDVVIGLGHSMGGAVLSRTASTLPNFFDHLLLVEPIILRPSFLLSIIYNSSFNTLYKLTRNRRSEFADREAAEKYLHTRRAFSRFDRDCLAAYFQEGFVDMPDGTVRLACHPEFEGYIYRGYQDMWQYLPDITAKVDIFMAEHHPIRLSVFQSTKDFYTEAVQKLRHGSLQLLPGMSHFAIMEKPEFFSDLLFNTIQQYLPQTQTTRTTASV